MQDVPQIVRERLKGAPVAVNHPDANTLAAFAEHSLSRLERDSVLEHLARCGDCRDIVALALPAAEPVETTVREANSGWLTWPGVLWPSVRWQSVRWGVVAAGIAVIASFGIMKYQQRSLFRARMSYRASPQALASQVPSTEPKDETRGLTTLRAESPSGVQATARAAANSGASANARASEQIVAQNQLPAVPATASSVASPAKQSIGHMVARGGFTHGPKMAQQWQQQQNANVSQGTPAAAVAGHQISVLSANVGVPSAPQPQAGEASSVPAETQTQTQPETERSQAQDQSVAESFSADNSGIGRAKPAVNVVTSAPGASTQTAQPGQSEITLNRHNVTDATVLPLALPRWTINGAGGLERSYDQGKTWQDIDVQANLSSGTAGTAFLFATGSAKESVNKKAVTARVAIVFRAVSANGADVWAGGTAGALYHSLDAGNHWTRVVPTSAGTVLTSDIVGIDFSDSQHGKITASDSSIWTTGDDGRSWQKQ